MGTSAILWSLSLCLFAAGAPNAKQLYKQAQEQFDQKQYTKAYSLFDQTIKALESNKQMFLKGQSDKAKAKQSQPWHLLNYGQANALNFQSMIERANKKNRKSCRLLNQAVQKLKALPSTWTTWRIPSAGKRRSQEALTNFGKLCGKEPSLVTLTLAPPNATIERQASGKWQAIANKPDAKGNVTIPVVNEPQLVVRIKAKGHVTQTQTLKVARWSTQSASFRLAKEKKVVAVIRRPPPVRRPTPKPVTAQPWFWPVVIGGGVLIAGGITAGIIAANQPYTEVLANCQGQPGFNIWGTPPSCI
jgi:hypothetical protein